MTKQQILDELELLKDSTNITGKTAIDGIKAAVMALLEAPLPAPIVELGYRPEETPWKPVNKRKVVAKKPIPKKSRK